MPYVSLLDSTVTYIRDVQKTGLYGHSFDAVVEELVLRGIREAIDKKYIAGRVFPDTEDDELINEPCK